VKTHTQTPVILKLALSILLSISSKGVHAQVAHPQKIAGKPISFYLNHNAITKDAKLYYEGRFSPADDDRTTALFDSIATRDHEIRPFYFFLLNQMMKKADGALTEYAAVVCSNYFSEHPCEFMQWQTDPVYEVSLRKWAEHIGFEIYATGDYADAFEKYTAGLKTVACKTKELDNFLNEVYRIAAEYNAH